MIVVYSGSESYFILLRSVSRRNQAKWIVHVARNCGQPVELQTLNKSPDNGAFAE